MAKKRSKKGVNLTMEDAAYTVGGAVAGLGLNFITNKVLDQQPDLKAKIGSAIPFAKVVGGGALAINKGIDRRLRFAAIGMAATGGVEVALSYGPTEFFKIAGSTDVFDMLGTTDVLELDVLPTEVLEPAAGYPGDAVMGTDPLYAGEQVL